MSLPPTPPVEADGGGTGTPTWGLGDVLAGLAASLFLSTFVGAVIVLVAGWEAQEGSTGIDAPIWGLALLQIPLWAGYLGIVVFAGRNKGHGVVADFGLRQHAMDVPVGLVLGILTQLVVLPLLYIPLLELTGTDQDDLSAPARALADRAGSLPSWILFAVLVGVCAPIVEELFYRGLFLRSLTKRGLGPVAAVVGSSVVFAAVHFQVLQFAGLLVFGLVAGTLSVRTGRLGPAIWAHIGFNMTTVVALYVGS